MLCSLFIIPVFYIILFSSLLKILSLLFLPTTILRLCDSGQLEKETCMNQSICCFIKSWRRKLWWVGRGSVGPTTILHFRDSGQLEKGHCMNQSICRFIKFGGANSGGRMGSVGFLYILMPSLCSRQQLYQILEASFTYIKNKVDPFIDPSFANTYTPAQRKPTNNPPYRIIKKWPREPHQTRHRRKYLPKLVESDDRKRSNNPGRSNGLETS